jgi:hypothetical protein
MLRILGLQAMVPRMILPLSSVSYLLKVTFSSCCAIVLLYRLEAAVGGDHAVHLRSYPHNTAVFTRKFDTILPDLLRR